MSLHLDCVKRNYELEKLKHYVRGKRIQIREDPLASLRGDDDRNDIKREDDGDEDNNDDTLATTIPHKLGQNDPRADFHKLEGQMLNREEFETWEAKKLKIFAQFKLQTDDQEIIIDERRDRDTDRVIRFGKGKSRMDQLEQKASKSSSRGVQPGLPASSRKPP